MLRDEREADDPGSYYFAARRPCLPSFAAPAPPFVPSGALTRKQAKSESGSPPQPLEVIQAPALSGRGHQHVTPGPGIPLVDHQSLIAEQKPLSASASANASASASIVSASGASASASASASGVSASGVGASGVGASCASATSHGTRVPTPTRPESPLSHARRGANPNHVPPARIETSPTGTGYRLSIALPRPGGALLASEMITVSARRGGRLAVVADAWHLEHDCEYTPQLFSCLHFSFLFFLWQSGFVAVADRH